MNLTNINFYAEGYYSGNSYEDNIIIRTETFEKLKQEIESVSLYIAELDGKHSEVEGDIHINPYTEDDLANMNLDVERDGDTLAEELKYIFKNNGLDLAEEERVVKEYLDDLDSYTTIQKTVRKSHVKKINDFIDSLGN